MKCCKCRKYAWTWFPALLPGWSVRADSKEAWCPEHT